MNYDSVRPDTKQIRWMLQEKHKGELANTQIAGSMKISARWVKKLRPGYQRKPAKDVVHSPQMGMRVAGMHGRREHAAAEEYYAR